MTFKMKPPARFIVLSRGGDGAALLNAHTWPRDNVLHVRGDRNAWVRHILMPEVPDLDGYLAHSLPSGHTR